MSGNVEVLAEYRYLKPQTSTDVGYESRQLPGPYTGEIIRLLPPADANGVGGKAVKLELRSESGRKLGLDEVRLIHPEA